MDTGTQWNEHCADTNVQRQPRNGDCQPNNTNGTTYNESNALGSERFEEFGSTDAKELILRMGVNPNEVIPYPSLAITRSIRERLQHTKQLLSRAYCQTNGEDTQLHNGSVVHEQVVPLHNPNSGNSIKPSILFKPNSLPAWPSYHTGDIVKYGRKGSLSQKRSKRVVINENAQPKVSEGFWRMKGVFQHHKPPIQDRLPPRSKSHIGFPRSATSMRNKRELPNRPHTSDMTGYMSKVSLKHVPYGIDPDLINPRLLVDVLESENVTVTAKDIYNASGWKNVRDSQLQLNDPRVCESRGKAPSTKRSLRPKHGTQRGKIDSDTKILRENRGVQNHSPERQVTSTPDVSSHNPKNKLYSQVLLTLNHPDVKLGTDDKLSDKAMSSPRSAQLRKGHYLKSPGIVETSKSNHSTAVVPVSLHSKDSKTSTHSKTQFLHSFAQPGARLLYGNDSYGDVSQSRHVLNSTHGGGKLQKTSSNGRRDVARSESRNECFMDVSISRTSKATNEKTEISRKVSGAIPLRMRSLVTPANTPVISRQSSQDWLDKSFDMLDCSYD